MQTPRLLVDFNNDDDADVIRGLRRYAGDADSLAKGHVVELYDREGNNCLGTVTNLDSKFVYALALWETWRDAEPVRITVPPNDLIGALRWQVLRSSAAETEAARKTGDPLSETVSTKQLVEA
jgi:hypothetical protein